MSTQLYKVGIEQIDREHEELFVLAASIHEKVIMDVSHDALLNDLKAFADALEKHFETEEKLFPQYAYPFMADHSQEHERLLNAFNTHMANLTKQYHGKWAHELARNMDSLCQHIITYDLLLNDQLEKVTNIHENEKGECRKQTTCRSEAERRLISDRRADMERRCAILSDMRSRLENNKRRSAEDRRKIQRRVLTDRRVHGERPS